MLIFGTCNSLKNKNSVFLISFENYLFINAEIFQYLSYQFFIMRTCNIPWFHTEAINVSFYLCLVDYRGGVSKVHHLTMTLRSGYSSSQEKEKVIVLYTKTFPFSKEGCHNRRFITGWLKALLK
jgi:hypothetical protein